MIDYNQKSLEFWRLKWRSHIVPYKAKYPEGLDAITNLKDAIGERTVRDIGCGYGRLASIFDPFKYIGFDIALGAIKKARKENPYYTFVEWDFQELPAKDVTLLYIVMLHVDDDDLKEFCELVSRNTNRIVIADIMQRYLNFPVPLCIGRDVNDYINMFSSLGFTKTYSVDSWYSVYRENLTLLVMDRG
jgi:SAM-dependent methyltransferase